MALFVASHYQNQLNDLQLLSGAPAHHLFVLLPPLRDEQSQSRIPEPIVVLQVALEGRISERDFGTADGGKGPRTGGDMIPWLVSQQYQEAQFASMGGARVVRVATHPDYINVSFPVRAEVSY